VAAREKESGRGNSRFLYLQFGYRGRGAKRGGSAVGKIPPQGMAGPYGVEKGEKEIFRYRQEGRNGGVIAASPPSRRGVVSWTFGKKRVREDGRGGQPFVRLGLKFESEAGSRLVGTSVGVLERKSLRGGEQNYGETSGRLLASMSGRRKN